MLQIALVQEKSLQNKHYKKCKRMNIIQASKNVEKLSLLTPLWLYLAGKFTGTGSK